MSVRNNIQHAIFLKDRIEVIPDGIIRVETIPAGGRNSRFLDDIGALQVEDEDRVSSRIGADHASIGATNDLMGCREKTFRLARARG